ncbi:Hypothetical protein PACV_323 [Pacmanvirus A23]|uniref:Hypothetical protein n=1 Tax=Pacmanvirus A23 TaxID=1932881 RepID=UPI000A091C66|nr:Hypothetical protein B9W72_gp319 [Pacmanvirus A23]SIP86036.1 Hypothetical protein PACV_323 [Pacmanvirus A23]
MSIIPTDIVLYIASYLHKTTITWTETSKYRKVKCYICGLHHQRVDRKYDQFTADIIDPVNVSTALALRLVSTDAARAINPTYIHYKIGGDFGVSEYIRLMKYNFKLAKPFIIYKKPTITKSKYEWDIETYSSTKNITFKKLCKGTGKTAAACYLNTIYEARIDYAGLYPNLITSYMQDTLKRLRNNFYGYVDSSGNTDGSSVGIAKTSYYTNLYSGNNTEDSIIIPTWNDAQIEQVVGRAFRATRHVNLPIIGIVGNDLHRADLPFEQNLEPEIVQPVPTLNIKHKKQKRHLYNRKDMARMNKITQRKQKFQKNYR